MAKCANCDLSATHRVDDPGALPVDLCASHVPKHLSPRVAAGAFAIVDEDVLVEKSASRAAKDEKTK